MTTTIIIWTTAAFLYACFWLWYVGIRKPLSQDEVDKYINKLKEYDEYKNRDLTGVRAFLENDTGKSFVMVNSIVLKKTPDEVSGVKDGDTSLQTLINYHKPFMKMMLKRGGIGIFQGRVAGKSFDVINMDNADYWQISGINRFRSRRDFIEILTTPLFHEKHELKFAALEKSIAYPVDPWFQLGGLTSTVGLIIALLASLSQIFLNQ